MISENNELIMEVWDRIKSHVPVKERFEVADTLVAVFDEFGLADDLAEAAGLDTELREAVRNHFGEELEEEDDYGEL